MVSIEDILAADSKIKTGADFPQFIKEIKDMGIVRNDVYVANGLSIYFDDEDNALQSSHPAYTELVVNDEPSSEKIARVLANHKVGETDYLTFCKQAADAGVEKWVVDLELMTCTYLDAEGNELLKENIPSV